MKRSVSTVRVSVRARTSTAGAPLKSDSSLPVSRKMSESAVRSAKRALMRAASNCDTSRTCISASTNKR